MYFWTIAIIASSIQYVGQFEDEAKCNKAADAVKAQYVKAACIQVKSPEVAKK
jgi:hypothetical protein